MVSNWNKNKNGSYRGYIIFLDKDIEEEDNYVNWSDWVYSFFY